MGGKVGAEEALDLVREFYKAFESGRMSAVFDVLSDDIDWEVLGPQEIPYAARYRGHEGVQAFFSDVMQTEELHRFGPYDFICCGNRVVALGSERGTIKATGKEFTAEWVHIFTLNTGKITAFREYIDSAQILKALIP